MKNIFYILLLLPTIIFAQYPSNSGQKITLGEQTTADGLVFRGVANLDTVTATSKITRANKQDTSAYILLDTVTNLLWHYKIGSNGWIQAGGSTLDTATMLLPYYRAGRNTIIQAGDVPTLNQNTTGSAATLTTGRTIQTNLASTSAATFNGSANITPGVTGILPVANGGTNASTFTAGSVVFAGANGTSLTQDNSNLFWDDTYNRLGIGTTSPSSRLEILNGNGDTRMTITSTGNTGASDFSLINSTGTVSYDWLFQALGSNGNFRIFDNAGASTGERFSIDQNGNVGIGTASPSTKLEIFQASYTGATNYANKNIKVNSGFGTGYTAGTKVSLLSSYDGTIYATDIGHLYDLTGYGLTFSTNDNTSGDVIERMRITSGGNVGIGTASPLSPLSVNASNVKSATGFWHVTLFDNTPMNTGVGGGFTFGGLKSETANEVFAAIDSYKENATPNNAAGAMRFHTQPSEGSGVVERMRITSTGNVGIGTASPVGRLDVFRSSTNTTAFNEPQQRLVNSGTATANQRVDLMMRWEDGSYNGTGGISMVRESATGRNGKLILLPIDYNGNGTEALTLLGTGEVTINNLSGSGDRNVIADVNGLLSAPTSSIMTKENVQVLNYGLNEILQINPVSFDYIDKNKWGDERKLGFIVEDMYPIIPEVTGTMNNGDMYLDMLKLIPVLTKAIQEQQALIKALEQRIINLENK